MKCSRTGAVDSHAFTSVKRPAAAAVHVFIAFSTSASPFGGIASGSIHTRIAAPFAQCRGAVCNCATKSIASTATASFMLLIYVMPSSSIRARAAKGTVKANAGNHVQRDPDVLAGFLEDAAHFPGGYADGLVAATCEADVANLLRGPLPVLAIGAQSSLTGGATPMGEVLLTTSRLNRIFKINNDSVHLEAGVTLTDLDAALRNAGRYYPPTPTFMGAFVGGTISTNAAGAATFKYGTTRDWVQAITVVLPSGDVLDIERGQVKAAADGYFDIQPTRGPATRVPVPSYRLPKVAKLAAGYFAAAEMDLIDLF